MDQLDMRGKQCPMPVIEAKKALDQSASGETVSVRVDNEIAVENLRRLAGSKGMELKLRQDAQDDFTVEITNLAGLQEKGVPLKAAQLSPSGGQLSGGQLSSEQLSGGQLSGGQLSGGQLSGGQLSDEQLNSEPSVGGKGLVVVIASDQMGEPESELGRILMKGFLYALSQQENLPETILFYNGGARLTTEASDSLEDLKLMEEQGVEILTCGTCLKHLGLEKSLRVGSVSNMYDIAEKMTAARLVIRP